MSFVKRTDTGTRLQTHIYNICMYVSAEKRKASRIVLFRSIILRADMKEKLS